MKKLTLSLAGLCLYLISISQTIWSDKVKIYLTGTYTVNAVIYTPANYSPTKKYPLVLFMHGMGEAGTNVSLMYNTGLPQVLKSGYKPAFDFIMVAPQRSSYSVDPTWLPGIMKDILSRFPIDTTRMYMTGLSAGGWGCYGSQLNVDTTLAKRFAAVVVCSGATQDANQANLNWWKQSKTPLWSIVGTADNFYYYNRDLVDSINKRAPVAMFTGRPGIAHTGWNDVYNGSVKTVDGENMWQWMYHFTRESMEPLPIKTHSLSVVHNQDGSFTASFIASATTNTKNFVLMYSSDGKNYIPVHVEVPDMLEERRYTFNFKIPTQ
jgi:predicted peptidase